MLYLDRYWREEEQVEQDLRRRAGRRRHRSPTKPRSAPRSTGSSPVRRTTSSGRPPRPPLRQWTTVLTGGPGTGKTTTVAGLLALLAEQAEIAGERRLRIALTAPTGKAAARLEEAVHGRWRDRLSDGRHRAARRPPGR